MRTPSPHAMRKQANFIFITLKMVEIVQSWCATGDYVLCYHYLLFLITFDLPMQLTSK